MTKRAPILALPNTLLFPHMVLPITVFDENYADLIQDIGKFNNKIAIVLHTQGWETDPTPNTTCCVGAVSQVMINEDGGINAIITGKYRALVEDYPSTHPFVVGNLYVLKDKIADQELVKSQHETLSKNFIKYVFNAGLSDQLIQLVSSITELGHLTDLFAFYLVKNPTIKQAFLDTTDVNKRAEMAIEILDEELNLLSPSKK